MWYVKMSKRITRQSFLHVSLVKASDKKCQIDRWYQNVTVNFYANIEMNIQLVRSASHLHAMAYTMTSSTMHQSEKAQLAAVTS